MLNTSLGVLTIVIAIFLVASDRTSAMTGAIAGLTCGSLVD